MFKPLAPSTPSCVGSALAAKPSPSGHACLLPQGRIRRAASLFLAVVAILCLAPAGFAQALPNSSIVRKLENSSERMEMIVNTSRILTLDRKIPQAQVNNPDILQIVPLAPDQIQISAKRAGVTQVNLWTEDKSIYTVDVIVFGDARELAEVLKSQFPNAALTVTPVANSVRISGYVDQPEHVAQIIRIAEEYYPKVINSITVSGVQQVLLHVRVMEVSRTKLRRLGFDFAYLNGNNLVASSVSGLIEGSVAGYQGFITDGSTFNFQVVESGSSFFGVLEALRQDKLLKILAEPNVVAISGRPASFLAGGSVPTLVPQSLGTVTVEYKDYGTQVDFVPIVLGNGKIRLEVRPHVSEIDSGRSIQYQGYTIYAFTERRVETGVEMKAGQTLAIAGLIQTRLEAQRTGLPWISEVPYLGALFSKKENLTNEIELLILVTPELVDPLDPDQVPPCGPGTTTTEPNDWELYLKGFIEVPRCPPCGNDDASTEGAAPCDAAPEAMPGMVGETQPETAAAGAAGSSSTAVRQTREIPYNPIAPQTAQVPRGSNSSQTLPSFKGRVGYEMLR